MERNQLVLKREFSKIREQYANQPNLDFEPYYKALRDSIHQLGNLELISIICIINQDGTFYWEFTFRGTPTMDIFKAFTWLEDEDIMPQLKWKDREHEIFMLYFTI